MRRFWQRSQVGRIQLDRRLADWKAHLPAPLNFERWSMEDAELTTKQKIVLKLRPSARLVYVCDLTLTWEIGFLSARILLHRPFHITAAAKPTARSLLCIRQHSRRL